MFELRFNKEEILYWADQYVIGSINDKKFESEIKIIEEITPRVQAQGYYTREEFEYLCRWKTTRTQKLVASNSVEIIEEHTRFALSTSDENQRMKKLVDLRGIGWPTASVLLHFGYDNLYPILDFRALWSLGLKKTPSQYKFDLWDAYTHYCRHLAAEANVSMRTLDRALWQYSKTMQGNYVEGEPMKIHVEIFIASRILAQNRPTFSPQDLLDFIRREFGDERAGISTHVSAACVANAPQNHPTVYNYLWRLSPGELRPFRPGHDLPHPDRRSAPTQPQRADVPAKFLHLLRPE